MTDRELLERATFAAGISASWDCDPDIVVRSEGMFLNGERSPDNSKYWNPLTDDGDALRLAVKLYLWEAVRLAHREVSDTVDIYAATRRAIVRAAAEIGRDQKETPDLSDQG